MISPVTLTACSGTEDREVLQRSFCLSLIVQQVVRSSVNATDRAGRLSFNIVRSGSIGDVIVQWRVGAEAVDDFYPPLDGSALFRDVIGSLQPLSVDDLFTFHTILRTTHVTVFLIREIHNFMLANIMFCFVHFLSLTFEYVMLCSFYRYLAYMFTSYSTSSDHIFILGMH